MCIYVYAYTTVHNLYYDIYVYIHTHFCLFLIYPPFIFQKKVWSGYKLSPFFGWNHKTPELGNLLKTKELTSDTAKNPGVFIPELTLQQWYSYCLSLCLLSPSLLNWYGHIYAIIYI